MSQYSADERKCESLQESMQRSMMEPVGYK